MFLYQVISGLETGSIYALVALGFVLVYRASDVANFAYGEAAMFSTFIAYTCLVLYEIPYPFAILIALVASLVLAILIERVIISRLIGRPVFTIVMVTLGLFMVIHNSAGLIWGRETKVFPSLFFSPPLKFGTFSISMQSLGVIGVALAMMIILFLFLRLTRYGIAIRATCQDRHVASLMGINIGVINLLAWGVSSLIGAIAGILIAPILFLDPNLMVVLLIKAFTAAILGGLTSLPGVFAGGIIFGIAENLVGTYVSGSYRDVFSLIMIILVLLVKPTGLFGRSELRKV